MTQYYVRLKGLDARDGRVVGSLLFEVRIERLESLRQPQDRRSGIAAIVGTWPGDEPDEVVSAALEELS